MGLREGWRCRGHACPPPPKPMPPAWPCPLGLPLAVTATTNYACLPHPAGRRACHTPRAGGPVRRLAGPCCCCCRHRALRPGRPGSCACRTRKQQLPAHRSMELASQGETALVRQGWVCTSPSTLPAPNVQPRPCSRPAAQCQVRREGGALCVRHAGDDLRPGQPGPAVCSARHGGCVPGRLRPADGWARSPSRLA